MIRQEVRVEVWFLYQNIFVVTAVQLVHDDKSAILPGEAFLIGGGRSGFAVVEYSDGVGDGLGLVGLCAEYYEEWGGGFEDFGLELVAETDRVVAVIEGEVEVATGVFGLSQMLEDFLFGLLRDYSRRQSEAITLSSLLHGLSTLCILPLHNILIINIRNQLILSFRIRQNTNRYLLITIK